MPEPGSGLARTIERSLDRNRPSTRTGRSRPTAPRAWSRDRARTPDRPGLRTQARLSARRRSSASRPSIPLALDHRAELRALGHDQADPLDDHVDRHQAAVVELAHAPVDLERRTVAEDPGRHQRVVAADHLGAGDLEAPGRHRRPAGMPGCAGRRRGTARGTRPAAPRSRCASGARGSAARPGRGRSARSAARPAGRTSPRRSRLGIAQDVQHLVAHGLDQRARRVGAGLRPQPRASCRAPAAPARARRRAAAAEPAPRGRGWPQPRVVILADPSDGSSGSSGAYRPRRAHRCPHRRCPRSVPARRCGSRWRAAGEPGCASRRRRSMLLRSSSSMVSMLCSRKLTASAPKRP